MKNRARAIARQQDARPWYALMLGGLLAILAAGAALAQPQTAVVHPPKQVDPKMRVTPPNHPALPTPVVRPPVEKDGTTLVPK